MPSRLRITNRHGPFRRSARNTQHNTIRALIPLPPPRYLHPASAKVTAGRISPNITHLIIAVHRGIIIPQTNITAPARSCPPTASVKNIVKSLARRHRSPARDL
ncbi:hypothetical protein CCHR01_18913 [Colletotrichum chrysophilum]|uniref:Uncharacterized protein n=1 Tax=Colletotrichum chrysophilum TaxID=1836956 RepID=A0AAD8ZZF8_9PEZI|nr:hypothetical protein CCHR01_18913 [Colletotrichum chrysophilum]